MKLLICSDSHGLTEELTFLKEMHPDMDHYIHCGDSELPPDFPAMEGFQTVKGNCDFGLEYPDTSTIDLLGNKLMVTHGHLFRVKSGLLNLRYKALEQNANIVCFGHSHVLGMEVFDDILFINPGSIRFPRGRIERTYVILEVSDSRKQIRVFEFGKGELFSKTF